MFQTTNQPWVLLKKKPGLCRRRFHLLVLLLLLFTLAQPRLKGSEPRTGDRTYPPVSSNMAGWKLPELHGCFLGKITDK